MINKKYEVYKDCNRITAPALVREINNKINIRVAMIVHEEHKHKQKQTMPLVSPDYIQ